MPAEEGKICEITGEVSSFSARFFVPENPCVAGSIPALTTRRKSRRINKLDTCQRLAVRLISYGAKR